MLDLTAVSDTVIGTTFKGMRRSVFGTRLADIASQRWNVPDEDLPLSLMVLKQWALDHNISTFADYCRPAPRTPRENRPSYISVLAFTVTGGFAIGPAIGGAVLAFSPDAVWWGGAVVAGLIGVRLLLVGGRIPDKPIAATASKAALGDPMPEAA